MTHSNNAPIQKDITINDLATRMDKGFAENKITTNGLAVRVDQLAIEMRKGFTETNKKIDDSIDELARMVAKGFKEVDGNLSEVREDIKNVEYRIDNLEQTIVKDHGTRIRRIERKLQLA